MPGATDEDLCQALLKFIADFANWNLASNRTYLDVSRALVKAAQGEEPPLVDPFAGARSLWRRCEAFRTEWRMILRLVGLNASYAVGLYLCFVYITTYLRQTDHVSKALDINTISIVMLLLLIVPAGALSDYLGRKPVLLAATGGLLVMSWPLFWMMHHPDTWMILLGQLGFAVLIAGFGGAAPAAMVELVPNRLRCTVLSVGYNLGFCIFGGLTPMVAIYTIKRSHDDLSPAFLLMAAADISFVVIMGLRETYKWPSSCCSRQQLTPAAQWQEPARQRRWRRSQTFVRPQKEPYGCCERSIGPRRRRCLSAPARQGFYRRKPRWSTRSLASARGWTTCAAALKWHSPVSSIGKARSRGCP